MPVFQDPVTEEENQQTNQQPGESSQNQQLASPSETNPFSLHLEKTVGWVKILPPSTEDISPYNLPESQKEHENRKPVPPTAVGSTSSLPAPDGEKTQEDKPDLTKPVTAPIILPFPEELSLSESCPGEAKEKNSILHPLLTRKPANV